MPIVNFSWINSLQLYMAPNKTAVITCKIIDIPI